MQKPESILQVLRNFAAATTPAYFQSSVLAAQYYYLCYSALAQK